MANPNTLSWVGASEREDNTTYLPEDRHGYNVAILPNGSPSPTDTDIIYTAVSQVNDFSMPIADLGNPLTEGSWDFYVQDEDSDGRRSIWSAPATIVWVISAPKSPTGLLVS